MAARTLARATVIIALAVTVSACEEGMPFARSPQEAAPATAGEARGVRMIERDVEAPDVFAANEQGLWDGRPSLGGIWVAYPDVAAPERVMIRNPVSGEEVVGALFRREREMPGPRLQVSSEAATALGLLAGQPTELSVVALRREQIPVAEPEPEATTATEIAAGEIESSTLDPTETAAAALAAVEATRPDNRPVRRPERTGAAATAQAPAASAAVAPLRGQAPEKPFIQIGIFSKEGNAKNAGESLRVAGIIPTIREQKSGNTTYWRVVVGPATSVSDRDAVLAKVKGLGYSDAYAVAN